MWSQRDGRLSTITKVKVLSPEVLDITLGEGLIVPEAGIAAHVKGECVSNVPGSVDLPWGRLVPYDVGCWCAVI